MSRFSQKKYLAVLFLTLIIVQKILESESFLKDHVTLKTVMSNDAENSALLHRNEIHFEIKIENSYFKL